MSEPSAWTNTVRLVGRVSGEVDVRELPSGDTVAAFRVVVPRPAGRTARPRSTARVDTIDVACWSARARRTAAAVADGDVVALEGSLRRRFFRAGGATASRYEVEVRALRRLPGR